MSLNYIPLKKLAKVTMGLSPKGNSYNKKNIGLPLLNGPTEFGEIHPLPTLFTVDSKRESEIGDLIFCVRGSTTGRMNWSDQVYSLGRGVCSITSNTVEETKFIKYYIQLNLEQLLKIAGGGTFPNLKKGDIENFPVPDLEEKEKIASILSAYDDLIENNLKRIKLLEEAAQRLYKEWFVDFKFPGHENAVFDEENGLPEGWEYVKSEDVFNINIGKTPPRKQTEWFSTKEGIKWVSISDINKSSSYIFNSKERITKDGVDKFNVKIVPQNTVLLSFKLTVGSVVITTENMVTNEAIAHFNINEKTSSTIYTYLYLKNFSYNTLGSTSSIGNALNSKIVKALPFLKVPKAIEDDFILSTENIFSNIKNLLKQNQTLKEARDVLLPRLMNRTIEVKK